MFGKTFRKFLPKKERRALILLLTLLVSVSGTFYPVNRVKAAPCA